VTPKDEISYLIQRGKALRAQADQALSTGVHTDYASIVGNLSVKAAVPQGYKGIARKIEKTLQKSVGANIKVRLREAGGIFLSECESKVRQMSINAKNLTISGNSPMLLRKFNRVRKIKSPLSFFDSLIIVLGEIKSLDLIRNEDIPRELSHRKEIAEREKREKVKLQGLSRGITRIARTVDLFNRLSISEQLRTYPSVQESILGALDRLQTDDPDAKRHCITSCRAAIERLCMEIGKNKGWKSALNNIFPSETDRKQVKGVWNYLSGKGAHGGHSPTNKEAEYCLQLTIATLDFIITKGDEDEDKNKAVS